jgi:hypothetical protein
VATPLRSSSVVAGDGLFHLVCGFVNLLFRLTFGAIDLALTLQVVVVGQVA